VLIRRERYFLLSVATSQRRPAPHSSSVSLTRSEITHHDQVDAMTQALLRWNLVATENYARCYDRVEPLKWDEMLRNMGAVFFALPLCLIAAADPFTGAWTLNLLESKLPPPLPRSQIVHIKANRTGIHVREEIVNEDGQPMTVTVKAKFDGKDYPASGSPFADSVTYQRIDSHTLKGVVKKAGKVVTTETATVSADGRTLTGAYTGTDATGKQVDAVAVFERK
jgi:hypothetical protein